MIKHFQSSIRFYVKDEQLATILDSIVDSSVVHVVAQVNSQLDACINSPRFRAAVSSFSQTTIAYFRKLVKTKSYDRDVEMLLKLLVKFMHMVQQNPDPATIQEIVRLVSNEDLRELLANNGLFEDLVFMCCYDQSNISHFFDDFIIYERFRRENVTRHSSRAYDDFLTNCQGLSRQILVAMDLEESHMYLRSIFDCINSKYLFCRVMKELCAPAVVETHGEDGVLTGLTVFVVPQPVPFERLFNSITRCTDRNITFQVRIESSIDKLFKDIRKSDAHISKQLNRGLLRIFKTIGVDESNILIETAGTSRKNIQSLKARITYTNELDTNHPKTLEFGINEAGQILYSQYPAMMKVWVEIKTQSITFPTGLEVV